MDELAKLIDLFERLRKPNADVEKLTAEIRKMRPTSGGGMSLDDVLELLNAGWTIKAFNPQTERSQ